MGIQVVVVVYSMIYRDFFFRSQVSCLGFLPSTVFHI